MRMLPVGEGMLSVGEGMLSVDGLCCPHVQESPPHALRVHIWTISHSPRFSPIRPVSGTASPLPW